MNPLYEKVGELAKQAIIQTMVEGEKTHPDKPVDGWKDIPIYEHKLHAYNHTFKAKHSFKDEDHIAHALTRLAMIKYLEGERK